MLRILMTMFVMLCIVVTGSVQAARVHHKASAKPAAQQTVQTVNINTADAATLASLNGIGPKKAQAIVAYRAKNGSFKSVDDLTAVRGIGSKFIERLKAKNPGLLVAK